MTDSAVADPPDVPDANEPVAPVGTPVVPDRADAPVSEIAERFLRAVIAKVSLGRIEELHLFSPLRQGGVETGIAVIAARVSVPVAAAAAIAAATTAAHDEASPEPQLPFEPAVKTVEPEAHVTTEVPSAVVADVDAVGHEASDVEPDVEPDVERAAERLDDAIVPVLRHTVYTARYRLVQKGPERGKWEADVADEADAPLITVEMVVRGVQRRAGEETETTRYTAAQIARALRITWPPAIAADPARSAP